MAYNKLTWLDRQVSRPLTFTQVTNSDGSITLVPAEGNIIQAGTPICAVNMNNIENGLADVDANKVNKAGDTMTGNLVAPVFISNVANGTAPLVVASSTVVANLNADKLDGFDATYFLPASAYTASDIMTKIQSVGGGGSNLDADKVDGLHANSFARIDIDNPTRFSVATFNGGGMFYGKQKGTSYWDYDNAVYIADTENTDGTKNGAFEARIAGKRTMIIRSDGYINTNNTIFALTGFSTPSQVQVSNTTGDRGYRIGSNFVLGAFSGWEANTLYLNTYSANGGIMTPAFSKGVRITGDLGVTGFLNIAVPDKNSGFEIGKLNASEQPYIDFHSSGTGNDYDSRIIARGGSTDINKGELEIVADVFKVPAKTWVNPQTSYGGCLRTLAIGDGDTGFQWNSDSNFSLYSSNTELINFKNGNQVVFFVNRPTFAPTNDYFVTGIFGTYSVGIKPASTPYFEICDGSGAWGATVWKSDISYKTNIKDSTEDALTKICAIKMREFDWIESKKHQRLGVISQELMEVDKSFAFEVPQPNDTLTYQPDETILIPYLIKSVQQLNDKNTDLEKRIAELESKLNKLLGGTTNDSKVLGN